MSYTKYFFHRAHRVKSPITSFNRHLRQTEIRRKPIIDFKDFIKHQVYPSALIELKRKSNSLLSLINSPPCAVFCDYGYNRNQATYSLRSLFKVNEYDYRRNIDISKLQYCCEIRMAKSQNGLLHVVEIMDSTQVWCSRTK